MHLNAAADRLCQHIIADAGALRVGVLGSAGARVIDLGIEHCGGLEAGLKLAEVCLAGLGDVRFAPPRVELGPWPSVCVRTDHPLLACLASQYAGWRISAGKFFAMGSGPMRVLARKEPLFEEITHREPADVAVGVLETRQLPTDEVCRQVAADCGIEPSRLTLLAAPTASQAGGVQIAARSVETALHKLHELGFDVSRAESGFGTAPLPPVAKNDLAAIGRTNDAILYGCEVVLWVHEADDRLASIGPHVPSCASPDYGAPFAEIFARYNHDFYKIDPLLFSPAVVTLINLDTGRSFRFGKLAPEVLRSSFGGL
jgi:methenyltetrahydromethanopterin cyclohydrolase